MYICIYMCYIYIITSSTRTSDVIHIYIGIYIYVYIHIGMYINMCVSVSHIHGEVGGWGRDPFSRNFMKPTPRRKWYLTTGRRFH